MHFKFFIIRGKSFSNRNKIWLLLPKLLVTEIPSITHGCAFYTFQQSLLQSPMFDIVIKCLFRNYLKNYMCWDTYVTVNNSSPVLQRSCLSLASLLAARRDNDIVERPVQSITGFSAVPVHGSVQTNWVRFNNQKLGYNSSQINTSFWRTNKNTLKSSLI